MDFWVKGTNGYYVVILPRMMQKCIPALCVISMACSYSGGLHVLEFSHSLYCPGLEDKRKRDWVLLYNKEDQENKASLIRFRSLGALIAYCNRSHPHSCNKSSHSFHSYYIHSLAVHSHNSGCMAGSSSCNLDSSSGPGLEKVGGIFVTTLERTTHGYAVKIHFRKRNSVKSSAFTCTSPAASSVATVTILLLLVDLFGLGYFNFTLKRHRNQNSLLWCL